MKKLLLILPAALPLFFTSCITDRHGSGFGEHDRWYADGSIRNTFYGRKYFFDPKSPHDAHARLRGRHNHQYRSYAPNKQQ